MELWIRSQDKEVLVKVDDIAVEMNMIYGYFDKNTEYELLGSYKSKERALEVLDEIQSKMIEKFIVKSHAINTLKGIDGEEARLKWKYNKEFIMEDPSFEFIPINAGIIVYDMPKE